MAKISQADEILAYMKEHGSITQMEAYGLGCMRLPSRIHDLKKEGYIIQDSWKRVENRRGGMTQVKAYRLAEVQNG